LAVVVAWVFFRASSLDAALCMLKGMVGLGGIEFGKMQFSLVSPYINVAMSGLPLPSTPAIVWTLFGLTTVWLMPNSQQVVGLGIHFRSALPNNILLAKPTVSYAFLFGTLFFISMLTIASGKVSEFLYFQF
jgi:alginate O-acetyltransferase complex protein AlgI